MTGRECQLALLLQSSEISFLQNADKLLNLENQSSEQNHVQRIGFRLLNSSKLFSSLCEYTLVYTLYLPPTSQTLNHTMSSFLPSMQVL